MLVLCRYEEAFHRVLSLEDISMVAWLCSQLDPGSLLSQNPPMLNQQILLPLIQQLGVDLSEVKPAHLCLLCYAGACIQLCSAQ